MEVQASPPSNKIISYANSASLVTQINDYSEFFTNQNSGHCGTIKNCLLLQNGCTSPYSGDKLVITTSTGKVESKQNEDAGYTETVCV